MSEHKSNPPRLAVWLLQVMRPSDDQALMGDLVETFREGKSRGWFWRQVFVAIAAGALGDLRSHWPEFTYAIAGAAIPALLWRTVDGATAGVRWWELPWPWSQLVMELRNPMILALAALPVLAAALAMNGTFRWISLVRTGAITMALIALWLRPVNLHASAFAALPDIVIGQFFSLFLVAAWLGCGRPKRRATTAA